MSFRGKGKEQDVIYALSGVVTTSLNGYIRLGSFIIDDALYLNPTASIEVVLEDSNSNWCDIRLYDVTGMAVVDADPLVSTQSATPALATTAFTLSSGATLYELQMKMRGGVAPDTVLCSSARVTIRHDGF